MTNIEHVKAGYADYQARTPWDHCPVTFEDWKAGAAETAGFNAYWDGWNAANNDAIARTLR